jgi:hypothetical protein
MKILGRGKAEVSDQQNESKTYECQKISHDLFLPEASREYQVIEAS